MWDEFSVKTIKDEWSLRYYFYILNLIGDQINKSIDWLDSEEAEKYFKEESQYHQKVFQSLEDEWDSILESKYDSVEALLDEVYRRGKAKGYTDMREHVRYTEADKLALEFVKNYNFDLIRRIDNDVRNEIKNKIISGFLAGDNPNVIAPKIQAIAGEQLEGSTFTPRQRATMIAKTEVSRVQNTGMLQSYVNEGYTEVKILTAEDNNVCATCLEYAYEFNKNDEIIYENAGKEKIHNIKKLLDGEAFPPFHPNCRCTYLSVWKTKQEPPINPDIMDLIGYNLSGNNNRAFNKSSIQEFNELKDDPNIEWSINEKVDFSTDKLNDEELFIKYHFKDNGLIIYKSIYNNNASVKKIYNYFKSLPNELTFVCKEIILSNQMATEIIDGKTKYIGGFTRENQLHRITILNQPNTSIEDIEIILLHELAHTIDGEKYIYSNHPDFIKAYEYDKNQLDNCSILDEKDKYVSEYSFHFTFEALNGGRGKNRPYSEDFSECVVQYFIDYENFAWKFPQKAKYINNILHIYY